MSSTRADAKAIGLKIREMLFSLYASNHSEEQEKRGVHSYATDELRGIALAYAGFCRLAPGEMAPGCGCDWSEEQPGGPQEKLWDRMGHMLMHKEPLEAMPFEARRAAYEKFTKAVCTKCFGVLPIPPATGVSCGCIEERR
jgi:hypothetical protein